LALPDSREEQEANLRALLTQPTETENTVSLSSSNAAQVKPEGRLLSRSPAIIALLGTLAAIHLHWIFLTHAGGLWRDEVEVANISTLPSVGALWRGLPNHCPVIFPFLVRTWVATFGGADTALRTLGFLVGLFLLGVLWLAGRSMWRGVPVLSLTLLGLNAAVIRYGDSIRAYGFGTACIVLSMALMWRYVETPTRSRWLSATAAATLSVQVLFQNGFLIGALCVGACVVFMAERQWPRVWAALAIGVIPALSLGPYIPSLVRAQDWWVVVKAGVNPAVVAGNVAMMTGYPSPVFRFVWLGLVASAIFLAAKGASSAPRNVEVHRRRRLVLFSGATLAVSLVSYGLLIATAQLPTQIWYFLLPAGFAIVCCEAILWSSTSHGRIAALGTAVITLLLAYPLGTRALEFRQTNGDIIGAQLLREADQKDLIIVNPWYCGVTFHRYYKGSTPWATLPDLGDYRYHRYDLLKAKLELAHPAQAVLDTVASTLQSGHRVWVVGWLPAVPAGKGAPPDLPPAPYEPWGWSDVPYDRVWGAQLDYLVETRALVASSVPVASKAPINAFENMRLYVFAGWRAPANGVEPPSK
jgi:hypothetical protein